MGGGLLKTIGYFALFYFVMRIMRSLFEPKNSGRQFRKRPRNNEVKKGDFIEYEEVD